MDKQAYQQGVAYALKTAGVTPDFQKEADPISAALIHMGPNVIAPLEKGIQYLGTKAWYGGKRLLKRLRRPTAAVAEAAPQALREGPGGIMIPI